MEFPSLIKLTIEGMEDILQDEAKFRRFDDDPIKLTLQRINKINNFLRAIKISEVITKV